MRARFVTALVLLFVMGCSATPPTLPDDLAVNAEAPTSAPAPTETPDQAAPTAAPVAAAQEDALAAWVGSWRGTLTARDNSGVTESGVDLEIAPLAEGRYAWRLQYEGEGLRDYEMVPVNPSAGIYNLDEKNGIVLRITMVGDTLYSLFRIGDRVFDLRYTLTDKGIRFDGVVSFPDESTPTGGGAVPEIDDLAIIDVQQGLLMRVDEGR